MLIYNQKSFVERDNPVFLSFNINMLWDGSRGGIRTPDRVVNSHHIIDITNCFYWL
jgi:hypothetical protein